MTGLGLIAILVAAFLLAIALVNGLGRLIDSGAPDDLADEPPDTAAGQGAGHHGGGAR
jgi:hypothetical protein